MKELLYAAGTWAVITAVLGFGAAWAVRRLLASPPDRNGDEDR